MAQAFTGDGDPGRSLALMWGTAEHGRRGPKPSRSAEEVIAAAVALADAEGLGALSMRRVAEAVGLSAMSLYTYVPSKAELIDVMLDRVAAEMADPPAEVEGWRGRLAFIARQRWLNGQAHPWTLQVATHRPPLGPNTLASFEAALRAIDGLGLTELEMDQVIRLVDDYVRGSLRKSLDAREVQQHSRISDQQWLSLNGALLSDMLDPERFPTILRVGEACKAAYGDVLDRSHAFEFGLERVLDGIGAFIASRGAGA
jgi:AcrR family transcriptional regulator